MNNDSKFSNDSTKERGRFIGISESVGHYMAFKILTNKSSQIIHHSNVRPANIPLDKNIHLDPLTIPHIVTSKRDLSNKDITSTVSSTTKNDNFFDSSTNVRILDTLELSEKTFLIPTDEDRQCL